MKREPIYVAGWPKSGCTWLTRLLGDALNCPTGGATLPQDKKEIATEGQDRPGPYVVRKAHLVLLNRDRGPAIPAPHKLAWRRITNERFVFIIRDPRDIAVSSAAYFEIPIREALRKLHDGWDKADRGAWQDYVARWLDAEFDYVLTSYEELLEDGVSEVSWILDGLGGLHIDKPRIGWAVERQSFANRVKHIRELGHRYPRGREFNLRFMRKGIAGDWRNHFNKPLGRLAHEYFGGLMKRLGYIKDDDWWKSL